MILTRGLASAAFFGAEVYLPYLLIEEYDFSPTFAGLTLTAGALAWAAASAIQGRLGSRLDHRAAVRIGSVLVLAAIALALATTALHWPAAVAISGWIFAGGGMGLLYPRLSVMTLALSSKDNEGFNSSAMSISDSLGGALALATTGIVFAAFTTTAESFAGVFALATVLAAAASCRGAAGGRRQYRQSRPEAATVVQAGLLRIRRWSGQPGCPEHGVADDGLLSVRTCHHPFPGGVDLHLPCRGVQAKFLGELGTRIEHLR